MPPLPAAEDELAERSVRDISIATAGHVDHGKSSLVEALTGTDPDRLPEERRREMTIELGFASLPRPDGGTIALIDVPGHERLIETMVAGVGGIDAALLVVAADDGPMPQTVEHLRILRLLGITHLVVAVTKTDRADDEWLALVADATRDLLTEHGFGGSTILPVSARTGAGMAALRTRLERVEPTPRTWAGGTAAWLPIDRVFQLAGHGTIITGTLARGELTQGGEVTIAPSGQRGSSRRLQSHGKSRRSVTTGQRVAVNLGGIETDQVRRGDVLSDRPIPLTSYVDVHLLSASLGPIPLRSGNHVRVLVGTDRIDATVRLFPGVAAAEDPVILGRLRFARPAAVAIGDRLILRRPSPPATLAGGVVLARHGGWPGAMDQSHLGDLAARVRGDMRPALLRRLGAGPATVAAAINDLGPGAIDALRQATGDGIVRLLDAGSSRNGEFTPTSMVIVETVWRAFLSQLLDELTAFHQRSPEAPGMPLTSLRSRFALPPQKVDRLLGEAVRGGSIVRSGSLVARRGYRSRLLPEVTIEAERLVRRLDGLTVGEVTTARSLAPATLEFLERAGDIIRLPGDRIVASTRFDAFGAWAIDTIRKGASLDLPLVRDRLGVSRVNAQLLLEHLDELGVTRRHGDRRYTRHEAQLWLEQRDDRVRRRAGQQVLTRWSSLTLEPSPSSPRRPGTDLFLSTGDPAGLITVGAGMVAARRTGRSVRPVLFVESPDARHDGVEAVMRRLLGTPPIVVCHHDKSVQKLAERIGRIIGQLGGSRDDVRLLAPLGVSNDPPAERLGLASLGLTRFNPEVVLYEDAIPDEAESSSLPWRLGRLIEQGFAVEPVPVSFHDQDRATVIEAVMADEPSVTVLSTRHGLDHGRSAVTNLWAGYHRTLGDDLSVERVWSVRPIIG